MTHSLTRRPSRTLFAATGSLALVAAVLFAGAVGNRIPDNLPVPFFSGSSALGRVTYVTTLASGARYYRVDFDDGPLQQTPADQVYIVKIPSGVTPLPFDRMIRDINGGEKPYYGYIYSSPAASQEIASRNDPVFTNRFPGIFYASQAALDAHGQDLELFGRSNGIEFKTAGPDRTDHNNVLLQPSLLIFIPVDLPVSLSVAPVCGDSWKAASEACDDGDTQGGDGCSASCTVESGFSCSGDPSVCAPLCTQDFPQTRLPASRPPSNHHPAEYVSVPGETRMQYRVHHDTAAAEYIPDCATTPTRTAVADGSWNTPATWDTGTVPGPGDKVLIPAGRHVTMAGNLTVSCVHARGGFLTLDPTKDTNVAVSDMILITGHGRFTSAPASCVRHGMTFKGTLDIPDDPGQFGLGLVGIDADIDIHGSVPAKTFSALAHKVLSGSTLITTAEPTGWRIGDEVILSGGEFIGPLSAEGFPYRQYDGYRYVRPTHQTAAILAVNGTDITLDRPLAKMKEEYVANVTRTVTFSSPADSVPGHTLFTGDSLVYLTGARFENLGRTGNEFIDNIKRNASGAMVSVGINQQGRYPAHLHHLGQSYLADGNVFINARNNPRYQLSVHASHGTVEDNVFYGKAGAQLVFENGFETGLAKHNLAMQALGGVDRTVDVWDLDEARQHRLGPGSYGDHGFNGFGISTASPFVAFRDNVITGAAWLGGMKYMSFADYQNIPFPVIPGSPFSGQKVSQDQPSAPHEHTTILSYIFDMTWSRHSGGLIWLAGNWYPKSITFKDMTVKRQGIVASAYSFVPVIFDGMLLDGEHATVQPALSTTGNNGITIINSRIQNFLRGWVPDRTGDKVENTHFANIIDNIKVLIGDGDNSNAHLAVNPRKIMIRNVTFGPPTVTHPSDPPQAMNIAMRTSVNSGEDTSEGWPFLSECDTPFDQMSFSAMGRLDRLLYANARVEVKNYNGTGEDFFVHFREQDENYQIPCLKATNRQLMEGTATGSLVARSIVGRTMNNFMVTDRQERPGILGYVSAFVPERFTFKAGDLWYINYHFTDTDRQNFRINWCADCIIRDDGTIATGSAGTHGTHPDAVNWVPGLNMVNVAIPATDGFPPWATVFLPFRMP